MVGSGVALSTISVALSTINIADKCVGIHSDLIVKFIQLQILPLLPIDPDDNTLIEQQHQ